MSFKLGIIRKEDFTTTLWSGGTSTQLMIYPPEARYEKRDFIWRLSTARVEIEESVFTHLPGFRRIIMIIEGRLKLEHQEHHSADLMPFEQDSFMGSWLTRAFGKVTDFNLMLGEGAEGQLNVIKLKEAGEYILELHKQQNFKDKYFEVFYVVKGSMQLQYETEKLDALEGDLVYIEFNKTDIEIGSNVKILSNSFSDIIQASIGL